ncbi:hypothetical protein Agabi119p4_8546 [Agaricus bisporus var. burnettii]|uniref:Uncharacterized protein n=1 Tax=Agaricus bisporus var. burnettii TaxID=192524 RepID=A0A8H7EZ30_AGABI|nr:hypothetical protein Agabi119p4_8546 [Agaricus bisporus var. burnettii]
MKLLAVGRMDLRQGAISACREEIGKNCKNFCVTLGGLNEMDEDSLSTKLDVTSFVPKCQCETHPQRHISAEEGIPNSVPRAPPSQERNRS